MSAVTRARLGRLVEEGPLDLAEANLLIAAEADAAIDMALALAHVEGLAQAARQRTLELARQRVRAMNALRARSGLPPLPEP